VFQMDFFVSVFGSNDHISYYLHRETVTLWLVVGSEIIVPETNSNNSPGFL
jgi:hypothetical protein